MTGLRRALLIDHELASLTVPSLYLWGTDDKFVNSDTVSHVLENAAVIRLQTIDGAGHLLTPEEPHIVAETVTEFLGRTADVEGPESTLLARLFRRTYPCRRARASVRGPRWIKFFGIALRKRGPTCRCNRWPERSALPVTLGPERMEQ